MDVAEMKKIDIVGGSCDCENKIVKRSLSKNFNKTAE